MKQIKKELFLATLNDIGSIPISLKKVHVEKKRTNTIDVINKSEYYSTDFVPMPFYKIISPILTFKENE